MNINKQEASVLVSSKINEGKNEHQAWDEVRRDKEFLKGFQSELKSKREELELERKRLARATRELIKLKENISKKKEEFNKKFIEDTKSSDNVHGCFATTIHLNRILNYLTKEPLPNSRIAEDNCMSPEHSRNGLNFLIKLGLVKRHIKGTFETYSK